MCKIHRNILILYLISKHPIKDVYLGCWGVATFASNTKSHDDKGRGRPGDCQLRREQDHLQTAPVGTWIRPWNFYDAKRKYAPKEEGDNAGEFLQLIPGGAFLPNPIKPSRSRSSKQKESAQETVAVNIELRTPTGTMMRISGNLTGRELKEIIIASSTHV